MPIYEYVCSKCKSRFELLRPVNQASKKASCPHCHESAERAFSAFSGYYSKGTGYTGRMIKPRPD